MTCKQIIINYLKLKYDCIIMHHILDNELPHYGLQKFNKSCSPASYHRNFCWLKNDPQGKGQNLLMLNEIELKVIVEGPGKVNSWRVMFKPINRDLFGKVI